jgi:hypothetical protein
MTDTPKPSAVLTDDDLIDNAACCAQYRPLLGDDEVTESTLRECIKLNVCKPLRDRIRDLEAAIRKTWHALDAAPPPHFITQDMRDAITGACRDLHPKPWEEENPND